jgi:hypothetical protein
MNPSLLPLAAALTLCLAPAGVVAQESTPATPAAAPETPADPKAEEAAKKARDEEARKKEAEEAKAEEVLKKEAEPLTRRLKGESAGKLWELVQKGDDAALEATGLPAATLETLKAERGSLKGLHSILANEKLGKEVLKQLVAYGSSSKFAKTIEKEAKAKESAEKERVREKKKARRERDQEE